MIYLVEDKPNKIDYALLDRAILFASEYLKLQEDLFVEVIFEFDPHDPNSCGSSDIEDDIAKIWINPRMKKQDIVVTLFHEMVHIQQITSNRLEIGEWPVPSKWMGEFVIANYKDLPWEIEAYRLEEDMMKQFGEVR